MKRRLADRRRALPIKPLLAARALRRARAAEVPARAGRPQAPPGRRPPDVLAAVAAALRGSQLDGVLDGVAPAVPRPGAGRLGAAPARRRRSSTTAGAGPSCARACEGVLTEKVRTPPLEGRVHHARDALAAGPRAAVQGLFRSPEFCRPAVLGRHGDRRRVRPVLRRRGRAVADLLAGDQHRDLAARLLRRRRHRARRPELPRRLRGARRSRRRTRAPGRGSVARDGEAQSGEPSLPAVRRRHLRPGSVEVPADHPGRRRRRRDPRGGRPRRRHRRRRRRPRAREREGAVDQPGQRAAGGRHPHHPCGPPAARVS